MAPQLVFDPVRRRWVAVAFVEDGDIPVHVGALPRSASDLGQAAVEQMRGAVVSEATGCTSACILTMRHSSTDANDK